ncbi:restriction endonuclease subunit S [Escherichia coli]|uniref:restriction endonuclease subunit S n=4 Tax=Escherichia coli TaxID=562 RepID=UPI000250C9E8|nr:restriction endonuclease subunit S [Escherichia coli]EFA8192691.1 restriction endonuclease subunit S [Escherichia coli O157]EIQ58070.1 type I restriction modification DNA specificity domain protein [Escherichia coli EPECa12]EEY8314678.1 restriction endonuclease subunit S [Escherichia coli]EFA4399775.1 restriction endonuclease subunit S [Escherichia coli]EFA8322806.1 restriction endonuclease subunit S [Escherichia coli O157]
MSELSYLEKLLDGVEVEWKPLKDVCDFKNGFAFKSSLFKETGLPIVRITNIDGFNVDLDEVKYFSLNDYKEDLSSFEVSMGNILIAMSGATTGKVGIYKKGTKCYLNQRVGKFIPKENILNNNYLYHFLLLNTETIYILAGGGAQPNLSSNALMSKLLIPIPCPDNPEKSLAIQSEIVRILDKFTALTAELTAELNMRKKQYNYYRDQLLSFKEGEVEWKALGEVAKIQRGASPRPIVNYLTEQGNGIPWIKIGDTIPGSKYIDKTLQKITAEGAQKSRILNPGDFVISNSMSFGRPYILRITGAIHDGWASISNFGEKLNADYLYHYLSSKKVKNYWESKINSGSVSNLNADIIKTLPVPLPDKQKQERISALLDKFDTLTNSITEGLPREIELRQKQYEYYRDLLFSFPKPETVSN